MNWLCRHFTTRAISKRLLAVAMLLSQPACRGHEDVRFHSLAELSSITNGAAVVPDWLPEKFEEGFVAFRGATDSVILRMAQIDLTWKRPADCTQVNPRDVPRPTITRNWWPHDVPPSPFSTYRHTFFRCSETQLLAFDPASSELLYWSL